MKTNFEIGEYGILKIPDLHDGMLETVHTDSNDFAYIDCRICTGERVRISFLQVQALNGDSFRLGNIIHSLIILEGNEIPEEELKQLLFGRHADPEVMSCKFKNLKESQAKFVHMQASYGFDMKLLCSKVLITDRNQ